MHPILTALIRHILIFVFALGLAVIVSRFLGINSSQDPQFLDISIALAAICLILYHARWILARKRLVRITTYLTDQPEGLILSITLSEGLENQWSRRADVKRQDWFINGVGDGKATSDQA